MRQACLVWTRGHAQGSWRSPHPLDPQASRGGGGASSSGRPGGDWWGQEGRGPGRWQLGGHETSVLRPDRHFSLCRRQPESPAPSRRPPIKCEVLRSCCLEFCPSSPPSLPAETFPCVGAGGRQVRPRGREERRDGPGPWQEGWARAWGLGADVHRVAAWVPEATRPGEV